MKYEPMMEQMSQNLQLPITLCVNYVYNAWYQCVKHTNYEWMNFAWFPLLSTEMLSLWWKTKTRPKTKNNNTKKNTTTPKSKHSNNIMQQ
jgi:hypothetical protein